MLTLTITPVENVDYGINHVKNIGEVTKKGLDWNDDVDVYNVNLNEIESVKAGTLSLRDHRIIIQGTQYHLLHFHSVG